MLDDIRIFVHVARCETLTAAATYLQIPTATLTRRLQKLENSLGVKLVNRTARHFSLTAEGQTFYQAYESQIQQLEETTQQLLNETAEPTGELHVLAPSNISTGILLPMWQKFIEENPNIRLKLNVGNQIQNMLEENVDLALRIGSLTDSTLYQQRLGAVQTVLVASPDYLASAGEPLDINALVNHKIIVSPNFSNWKLTDSTTNEQCNIRPSSYVEVNDIQIIRRFLLQGMGVSLLPLSEVVEDLKNGELVRVLPDWSGPTRGLFAVWPSGKLLSAKGQTLKTHMQQYISQVEVLTAEL